jgi:ATP-dependent Clp protease ATP-binding subunit ClpC
MFERFSDEARQVVVLAQEEARVLKHNYLGTEHLLLGLLRVEEGIAGRTLASLDVTVEKVRREVVRVVGRGEDVPRGQIPFTPRAKKVLELAVHESASLGHDILDSEHFLLGLLKEGEGVAALVLQELGVTPDAVRRRVIAMVRDKRAEARAGDVLPPRSYEVDQLLEAAAREARRDGSPKIGLRHLVRALAELFDR